MSKTATGVKANGAGSPHPGAAAAAKTAVRARDARQSRYAQSFAQIVAVLMRDPDFRNLRLCDLEWLVLPPVIAGQFRLAQAPVQLEGMKIQAGRSVVPVAVALWAGVSKDIDKALSENLDKQVRLKPNQWASGDHLWLMTVAGDQRAVPSFLKQLGESEFKGRPVKMRMRGPEGKVAVQTLGQLS